MDNKFEMGTTVRSASGGPVMTIQFPKGPGFHCAWFEGETLRGADFMAQSLVRADVPGGPMPRADFQEVMFATASAKQGEAGVFIAFEPTSGVPVSFAPGALSLTLKAGTKWEEAIALANALSGHMVGVTHQPPQTPSRRLTGVGE